MPRIVRVVRLFVLVAIGGCVHQATTQPQVVQQDTHADHMGVTNVTPAVAVAPSDTTIAPGAADAKMRLDQSPRHAEWVTIRTGQQPGDSLRLWVVYPQRSSKAPVVLVVHEIFGLTTWVKAVADRLAADGFIAIAPDFLTGKIPVNGADSIGMQAGMALVRGLDAATVQRQLDAAAVYGMSLPAAQPRYGVVGFCWGGGVSFAHAVHAPSLGASVVFYGTSPDTAQLASVRAPVLGLYAGEDARVDATVPPAAAVMSRLGKSFTAETYPGAGHGYMRAQDQMNGANFAAARRAWPAAIAFFKRNLER
jgi:carboxymethylenebutenolidase